ncbi:hypothetical protein V1509DRAFT_663121 [Lipomyces kononenkoae]
MNPQKARNPMKDDSPLVPPLYFTIIQDTTTDVATEIAIVNAASQQHKLPSRSRTYHPRVHYVFSDDADNPDYPSPFATATGGSDGKARKAGNERAIIVDFAHDARTVLRATSLSPDWQVTNAETSSLAMRSGATGGGIDIGKMLTIEGIGSGSANHKLVAAMTRRSKQDSSRSSSRSGSRQTDESQGETELEAAFTYAQLFTQTNLKLNRLIEQSPPDEYLKIVEQLKTVNLRTPSPSRPEDNLAANVDGVDGNQYQEPGFSTDDLHRNTMQSSAEPGASLPRSVVTDLKGDEEPPAFTSGVVATTIPEQATFKYNETSDDTTDLDKTIVKSDNETQTTDAVSEVSAIPPEMDTHQSTHELPATDPPAASSADSKQDSFSSPWAS